MRVPERSCVACRRRGAKPTLRRLALRDGTIVLDPRATIPGRGAYLCHRPACAEAALARGASRLLRALRAQDGRITVDEDAIRAGVST